MEKENFFTGKLKRYFAGANFLRTCILLVLYSCVVCVSLLLAYMVRFDFATEVFARFSPLLPLAVFIPVNIGFLALFGQFKTLMSFIHLPDVLKIFWCQLFAVLVLYAVDLALFYETVSFVPKGVLFVYMMMSITLLVGIRTVMRSYRERSLRNKNVSGIKKRAMIIGAGDIGTSLASELLARRNLLLDPVLFLDDDKRKWHRQIMGIEVLPLENDYPSLVHSNRIDRAIVASSKFSGTRISKIISKLRTLGVETSIVPSYSDLASGRAKVSNLREVSIEDVLGRDPVKLDDSNIGEMIKNKVVLVTGAGGSIGGEICRQVAARSPSLLLRLDHCEVQLFQIEQDLISREFGTPIKPLVGSVADEKRMEYIISHFRPDIILHAAAHKHVPMMESQPSEALKNNAVGTFVAANLASKYGVEKFLLISTDKAINPTNVMGATKRLAERIVQSMQSRPDNRTKFVAVRFGNVLGSSGSVIPTFKKQIERGGPVTITHPEVTRYFMTIPEAVGLVLQCACQADGGEIFVLNMGEPVKVIDLARHMIELSGLKPDVDIAIKVIGLRPGEKLYEELQHGNELLVQTSHPRIFGFKCTPPSYDEMKDIVDEIRAVEDSRSVNELKEFIHSKIPEYRPQFYD